MNIITVGTDLPQIDTGFNPTLHFKVKSHVIDIFRSIIDSSSGILKLLDLFNICETLSVIHDSSVWLITGYNPANINQFQSHTGKLFYLA